MDINKDAFRKWIAALRSGKFAQTKGKLTMVEYHEPSTIIGCCCLGVACEVALENGIELEVTHDLDSRRYDGMGANLPHKVIDWLGVVEVDDVVLLEEYKFPEHQDGGLHKLYASTANDHLDISWTFEQIADALEKKYLPEDVKE